MTRSSPPWSRHALGLIVVVLALLLARTAEAHGTRTATLGIDVTSDTEARLSADVALVIEVPGCTVDAPAPLRVLRCPRGIAGAELTVSDLGRSIDLVMIRVTSLRGETEGATLTSRAPALVLPGDAPLAGTALRYTRLGCEHIFSGLDHLLFLLALFWQAYRLPDARGSVRRVAAELLRTATAFTVAHSLTLAGSVLGWLRIPASVAEACIALSLVLVALDLGGAPPRRAARVLLAFSFGLVHGLGFAGALAETRLPQHALALGLLTFNAGVELGQALVFVTCLVLVTLARRTRWVSTRSGDLAAAASAYAIGSLGVAMFLLRASALLRG